MNRRPRILIADDDRLILMTLAEGLAEANFEVFTANDGVEALEIAREEQPDLALLDIRMPRMDGLDLAERLRVETAVPFMFLSAYSEEMLVKQVTESGALGYLVKPLDVAQVIPQVRAALARAKEIYALRQAEQSLAAALVSNREIGTAVGMVMQRYGLGAEAAFETLRGKARRERRRLQELASGLVSGAEAVEFGAEDLAGGVPPES
ncbi:putative transcriptional regulatory protein pdtaR [Burkholderiales bacterium]|nr:MAG: response regulator [Burkholderiales bacterium]CAG0972741.1 putative transcriptional regulatory protein pdtaR [Burkholderiales bacterium]